MRYALVYQCGLANVFELRRGQRPLRLLQHAYGPCEWYVRGARTAGAHVSVWHCDMAGDIASMRASWQHGAGDMFADGKYPPEGALCKNGS